MAIDDFGTGQSGLQQLLGLEVDFIKIDRSFISLLGKGLPAERLVRGMAAMATYYFKQSLLINGGGGTIEKVADVADEEAGPQGVVQEPGAP